MALLVVLVTAKGFPRGQWLPLGANRGWRQKMVDSTVRKGDQLRLEDSGLKVEGANPSAGKDFSLEISVKVYPFIRS